MTARSARDRAATGLDHGVPARNAGFRSAGAILTVLALAATGFGCSPEPRTTQPRGRVVFDAGHGEIFGPADTSALGHSSAVKAIEAAGFRVDVVGARLTDEVIGGADGVILAGPMRPLAEEEAAALDGYVRRGGTLIVTIHVPFPVMRLPARFGLPVRTSIVRTSRPTGPDAGVLRAEGIADDTLTEGVSAVGVLSGWQVETSTPEARLLVSTGTDTWIDMDGDGELTGTDRRGPFGMIGVSRIGRGTVVVSGDDAVFANAGMGEADNEVLFTDILRLMGPPQES